MTKEESARLADIWVLYCLMNDSSKKTFLLLAQTDRPRLFEDCVPAIYYERKIDERIPF